MKSGLEGSPEMRRHERSRNALALMVLVSGITFPVQASPPLVRASARGNLMVAMTAADSWADDARLVWIENDSPLQRDGSAIAWGYLFYSAANGSMRSYSIRDGKIRLAEDHAVTTAAPSVEQAWKDSPEVAPQAWKRAQEYCAEGCELETMLLVSGVFHSGVTWVAVFSSGQGPRLHVVVDASSGGFLRRWKG